VRGERRLTEWLVPWLDGYEQSQPVRIGNAAHNQFQLDIFGEVMDALHQARQGGLGVDEAGWAVQREMLVHVEKVWREPDEGIWEVRSKREHFTYSKAMAWVAFDRAIKSAEKWNLPAPLARWRKIRQEIHEDVCARGFDRELNSFVRAYGTQELDASLLLLPAIGFLPGEDPRIRGTVAAIERRLMRDGLVYRYHQDESDDGLRGDEGVFLACSFWLADAYLLCGRREDAVALFERLLSLRNDVGLLSEEYEPRSRRFVGNFPQAFSHLALVNTASNIAHHEKPAEQRSDAKVAEPQGA
jgi:GH15 family glucan-1,4-alpha-glucosidase